MASADSNAPSAQAPAAKVKKPRASKGSKPAPAHPPYVQMIKEAISALKDRTGSSQQAIARYIDEKYKSHLPANHKKILSNQLRNLAKSGKLVKVKASFKLSDELKKPVKPAAAAKKPVSDGIAKKPKAPSKSAKTSKPKTEVKATNTAAKPKPQVSKSSVKKPAKAASKKPSAEKKTSSSPKKPVKAVPVKKPAVSKKPKKVSAPAAKKVKKT
eukprot:TRINITY_DN29519_c0_g1_i1.p1 TRINITY_DN29519_c0_g1~~TRINITY_DN29519_c0_g1_i1.p1  ORF type:complete len:214 (+),score=45.88 TRINITY_DN29519_c0_g1_i1:279-920(+)